MEKTFCDICKGEISSIDRTYMIQYGETSGNMISGMFSKSKKKNGVICRNCCFKINEFVQGLKT